MNVTEMLHLLHSPQLQSALLTAKAVCVWGGGVGLWRCAGIIAGGLPVQLRLQLQYRPPPPPRAFSFFIVHNTLYPPFPFFARAIETPRTTVGPPTSGNPRVLYQHQGRRPISPTGLRFSPEKLGVRWIPNWKRQNEEFLKRKKGMSKVGH